MAGRHPEDVETPSEEIDDSTDAGAVEETDAADEAGEVDGERSDRVVEFWAALGIDPVEVSFPRGGTGLTLRQYRVAPESADESDEADADEADEAEADKVEDVTAESEATEEPDVELVDDEGTRHRHPGVAPGEEEAFFLATDGRLHMFRTPESLVAFVRSNPDNDLADADTWDELVTTLTADLLVPDEEDTYELDLVVDNLRGGHDVWERDLIVGAGEFARDVAYALDLSEVEAVLASGSPLDDLDEAIRAKGFLARRKLRKIGAEQAALGWRSVIGRISSSVEWHD